MHFSCSLQRHCSIWDKRVILTAINWVIQPRILFVVFEFIQEINSAFSFCHLDFSCQLHFDN